MAPEKRQKSVNGHKLVSKSRKDGVTNGVNTHTHSASDNETSLQQPSQPYADTSTYRNAPTSTQRQVFTHETFQSTSRPWTQEDVVSNTRGDTNGPTPMERWQNERTEEQPWHVVRGVSFHNEGYMDEDLQEISLSNDGRDGVH